MSEGQAGQQSQGFIFRFTSERELGRLPESGSSGKLRLRRVYQAAKAFLDRS